MSINITRFAYFCLSIWCRKGLLPQWMGESVAAFLMCRADRGVSSLCLHSRETDQKSSSCGHPSAATLAISICGMDLGHGGDVVHVCLHLGLCHSWEGIRLWFTSIVGPFSYWDWSLRPIRLPQTSRRPSPPSRQCEHQLRALHRIVGRPLYVKFSPQPIEVAGTYIYACHQTWRGSFSSEVPADICCLQRPLFSPRFYVHMVVVSISRIEPTTSWS
jgi:hypothetical protein